MTRLEPHQPEFVESAGIIVGVAKVRRLASVCSSGSFGKTGKVVAETLLSQNKKVRVVVRDVAKGQVWKEAGADVSIADVEDNAAFKRAFSDTEGGYVLLPPNFSSTQVRAAPSPPRAHPR